jgi:putative flippase GtrA
LLKIVRYSLVSLVSVAVSQSVLMVAFGMLHWTARLANVVACAVATVPSYFLNRCWAWGRRGRSHLWKEVVPFWVIAFAGLALSTWAADLGSTLAREAAASHAVTTAIVMTSSLLAFGVLWIGKFAIFNALLFSERPQPRHLRPPSRRRELVTATRSLRAVVVAVMTVGLLFAGSASMRAAEPALPDRPLDLRAGDHGPTDDRGAHHGAADHRAGDHPAAGHRPVDHGPDRRADHHGPGRRGRHHQPAGSRRHVADRHHRRRRLPRVDAARRERT